MLTLPFAVIAVVSLPIAAFAVRSGAAEDRGMMPPSFVVDFTALLLLGGDAALVIAALGVVTRWAVKDHTRPLLRTLVNGLAVLSGTEAAWLAYRAAGGAAPPFTWPWEAVPIAAALAAYVLVKTVCANVLAP